MSLLFSKIDNELPHSTEPSKQAKAAHKRATEIHGSRYRNVAQNTPQILATY